MLEARRPARVAGLLATDAALRKARTWFRLPNDPTLYRSLAAWATAHAVAARAFGIARPTIQAKECVACVAMHAHPDAALADKGTAFLQGVRAGRQSGD